MQLFYQSLVSFFLYVTFAYHAWRKRIDIHQWVDIGHYSACGWGDCRCELCGCRAGSLLLAISSDGAGDWEQSMLLLRNIYSLKHACKCLTIYSFAELLAWSVSCTREQVTLLPTCFLPLTNAIISADDRAENLCSSSIFRCSWDLFPKFIL